MKFIYICLTISLLSISVASAQKVYSNKAGAIKGYDPVAYFTEKQAVKGEIDITYNWQGATWHFTTEDNKQKFANNPEQFAPQYIWRILRLWFSKRLQSKN